MSRKSRAVLSGVGIGVASIFAVAMHFDLDMGTLGSFMLSTLVFFVCIVLLAGLALVTIKGISRLIGGISNREADTNHGQPSQEKEEKPE